MKLYHSTSEIFVDQIKLYGLGGRNPHEEKQTLGLVKYLFNYLNNGYPEDNGLQKVGYSTEKMINQELHSMNFQHGQTYCSIDINTALRYSLNEFGSEILSRAGFLYSRILENEPTFIIPKGIDFWNLPQMASFKFRKLLIVIKVHNLKDFVTEKNEDAQTFYDNLMNICSEDKLLFDVLKQQANFRLTSPVDFKELSIFIIEDLKFKNLIEPTYNLTALKV